MVRGYRTKFHATLSRGTCIYIWVHMGPWDGACDKSVKVRQGAPRCAKVPKGKQHLKAANLALWPHSLASDLPAHGRLSCFILYSTRSTMSVKQLFVLGVMVLLTGAVRCADVETITVSPAAISSSLAWTVDGASAGLASASLLHEFTETCQINFSYVSNQPISMWLSVEDSAQALLILPEGRPCLNQTACFASKNVDPTRRYFLLAENLYTRDAILDLNYSAAASSTAGTSDSFSGFPLSHNEVAAVKTCFPQLLFRLPCHNLRHHNWFCCCRLRSRRLSDSTTSE